MLMCYRHWTRVPRRLQLKVWHTYRPGQEIDKRPTREYFIAAKAAIDYIAQLEGHIQEPEPELESEPEDSSS